MRRRAMCCAVLVALVLAEGALARGGFERASVELRVRRWVDAASGAAGGTGCLHENLEPI